MIKTIIFDNNGVLTTRDKDATLKNVADFIGVSVEDLLLYWETLAKPLDRGLITNRQFILQLLERMKKEADIDKLMKIYLNSYKPNVRFQSYVKTLKGKYELVLLTNFGEAFQRCRERWGIDEIFEEDKVFLSADLGMIKPDKEIFEYVLGKIGREPAETIFVDDREENVRAAETLGIHGILFEGLEKFEKDLDNVVKEKAYGK